MSEIQIWTFGIVIATFMLYVGIAIWSRAGSTSEFYVAGKGVPRIANGAATAADWMSAASFLSMAGLISFAGRDGAGYLLGWTGGYVLLALLLAPYLRKFGQYTVPDFVGERYYCRTARLVAVLCAIFVSFTYVAGQMRGVGLVFSRFLGVDVSLGVVIGMLIVFIYAVLGGMKGITYTQVAQYCVLIFAFLVPAIYISILMTNRILPQWGMLGDYHSAGQAQGVSLISKLNGLGTELGFDRYTSGKKSTFDMFCFIMALMVGTAGLPHVIIRFYTVKKVSDARASAFWALFFIAILYTTAPAVAMFARTNLLNAISNQPYEQAPKWFTNWETSGLIAWVDKNDDGIIQYRGKGGDSPGIAPAFEKTEGAAKLAPKFAKDEKEEPVRGAHGQRLIENTPTANENELYIDRDIMVLANPEIAKLPNWVIALVAAGGLAAALSTAAGLLLVISTSFAHDLVKRMIKPDITDRGELFCARLAAGAAVVVAGLFGIKPPGFVGEVVAFAFGLAAASFFPTIVLGIFSKRMNRYGAISGMLCGILFTASYICYFKFGLPFVGKGVNDAEHWLWGVSPEGIGTIGMLLNFIVAIIVGALTPAPPKPVQEMVEQIRMPGEVMPERK